MKNVTHKKDVKHMLKVVKDTPDTINVINTKTGKLVLQTSFPASLYEIAVPCINQETGERMIIVSSDMIDKMFFYKQSGEMVIGFVGDIEAFYEHKDTKLLDFVQYKNETDKVRLSNQFDQKTVLGDEADGIKVDIRFVLPTHYSFYADPRWVNVVFDLQHENELDVQFKKGTIKTNHPSYYCFDMQHRMIMSCQSNNMEDGEKLYVYNHENNDTLNMFKA